MQYRRIRAAIFSHRTRLTLRGATRANRRTEVHQGGMPLTTFPGWDNLPGQRFQFVWFQFTYTKKYSRYNPSNIRVDDRHLSVVSEAGDGAGGVRTETRQRFKFIDVFWPPPIKALYHRPRRVT